MKILSIDPGSSMSGFCIFDGEKIFKSDKVDNESLLKIMFISNRQYDTVVIEMLKSYGTLIGDSVLETAVWIGRFEQHAINLNKKVYKIHRKAIVTYLCGSPKANDSNVKRALIDRYAPNTPNYGKGSKQEKGFFYGFKADIWSAFSIAVYTHDHIENIC